MEITSGILSASKMNAELQNLPNLLIDFEINSVDVFFGFGCKGNMDDLYKPKVLSPNQLLDWIVIEGNKVGFEMSFSDLFVEGEDGNLKIQFCHDSDIHVSSNSLEVISRIKERWLQSGFKGYELTNENWTPFANTK